MVDDIPGKQLTNKCLTAESNCNTCDIHDVLKTHIVTKYTKNWNGNSQLGFTKRVQSRKSGKSFLMYKVPLEEIQDKANTVLDTNDFVHYDQ